MIRGHDPSRTRGLARARRLFPRAKPILRAYPHVHGVGVGFCQSKGKDRNEACFVVTVTEKGSQTRSNTLPRQLFGVRVDVQQAVAARMASVAAGHGVKQRGRQEVGHIGLVALGPGNSKYALTAMHILIGDTPSSFPPEPSFDVQSRPVAAPFQTTGVLEAGRLASDSDVARIRVNSTIDPLVEGTDLRFGPPFDLDNGDIGIAVRMNVPGQVQLEGIVQQFPCDDDFLTDTGVVRHFTGLAKFWFGTPAIQPGWSGSLIYRPSSRAPVALLSFGSMEESDEGTYAWGFPLFPIYTGWSLRPA